MRRLLPSGLTGAFFLVALTSALAGSALAYFTSGGLGSASAAVTQLAAPTITAATPGADGTVALSWSAVTPPGSEAVKYYVSRDGGEAGGTCAAPAVPTAATSCVDSDLDAGTYSYKVTAVWRSWNATSTATAAKVTIGAGTHFDIAAATTAPAVGASDNLTITVKDGDDDTVTSYTGAHSLTFSGASASPSGSAPTVANSSGTAVVFGNATALTFTAGVAKVSSSKNGLLKIYRSGPASIAAADGSIETGEPLELTVASGAPTKYTLAAETTTPVAGAADDLTITAADSYGNAAASYDGLKNLTFSGPLASPGGNLPTVSNSSGVDVAFGTATAIDFDKGVASAVGAVNGEMTLYKSGVVANVKATDGTLNTPIALVTTTAAAAASKLVLTGSTATPSATGTSNLTTTVQDPYANTVTTYTGLHDVVFSGASASPSGTAPTIVDSDGTVVPFGTATELNFKVGVAAVASAKNGLMRLGRAGATSISASDGTISTATPLALTVAAGTASKLGLSNVTASAGSIGSPCLFTCPVTGLGNSGTIAANVAVTDTMGNTVSAVGSGHSVKVTANGGTIAGGTLTIATAGPAVSTAGFTYTAPASGSFSNTVTAAVSAGTSYTSATATASK